MARVNAQLLAFNRGEISKHALARVDVEKLRLSADCQLNWSPWVTGAMMLRPGLQYIATILNSGGGALATAWPAGSASSTANSPGAPTLPGKLVRFVKSTSDTALIELTGSNMRVLRNDALITRVSVATAITNGTFASGSGWDLATGTTSGASASIVPGELLLQSLPIGGVARASQQITVAGGDQNKEHGLRINVGRGPVILRAGSTNGAVDYIAQTNLDTGWHSLAFTPTGASVFLQIESAGDVLQKIVNSVAIDAAGALTLPTPWTANDLGAFRYDQSGDIIFVACYGIQQYKIERRTLTSWSVVVYESGTGPFGSPTPIVANVQPSLYQGFGTMSVSRPYFNSGHINALFRVFETGQFYLTTLGGDGIFTASIRVVGVGSVSRNFTWVVAGAWVGTLTLQRSFDGADRGFVDVASTTSANGTFSENTGGSGGNPNLDNQIVWYRLGFKAGNYTSGTAVVNFNYSGGGAATIVRCIGFNTSQSIQIETLTPFSAIDKTASWLEGDWSGFAGWPTSVVFFEGRLYWSGRDRTWGSRPDSYYDFAQEALDNTPYGDGGAIVEAFGSGPTDSVNWLLGLTRLLYGREGSIASARSSAYDQVLLPSTFSVKPCSPQGAARLPAIAAGKRAIFVQQSGRRVFELIWNPSAVDYEDRDLTRLNLDIGKPGFTWLDRAVQPDGMVYLPRGDGQCACFLDDPDDKVEAWWRMQTLGVIEDVCVLPSGALEDNVYFIVKRIINGNTVRFIEKLAQRDQCVGGTLNRQLDAFLTFTGPVSSITLAHLPSTSITVWADGTFVGTFTSNASGVVALGASYNSIVAGLAGAIITGSTNPLLFDNTAPTVSFGAAQGTLNVGTAYNGYPAEVFADVGGTGRLAHIGALVVAAGIITLPNNAVASTIVAMLGYVAPFMSAKLAYGAQMGSALTQKKQLGPVGLILNDTHYQGIKAGQRMDALDPLPLVESDATTPANTVWPHFDGPMIPVPGEWDTDARLCLLAQAPYPCTLAAAVVGVKTNEG